MNHKRKNFDNRGRKKCNQTLVGRAVELANDLIGNHTIEIMDGQDPNLKEYKLAKDFQMPKD
jgi:hypothetical protein